MGRVSLTEDYDDRSVISKLNEMDKRVTENTTVVTSAEASAKASAQAAQETADRFAGSVGAVVQNANAQINASKAQVDQAKAEVDETVTTVAQAVQTVAGYENRLSDVELKITTVEGDIVTIQGRITALETADGQNVKINTINKYAVGLTGNQDNIAGIKTFVSGIINITTGNPEIRYYDDRNKTNLLAGVGVRYKTATSTNAAIRSYAPKINPSDNNEIQRGGFLQLVSNQDGTMMLSIFGIKADGSLASKVIASFDGTSWS